MTLSIGEVAAASGLRPSALRYYEERGLIRPVARRGGRRHYDGDVLARLDFIALCRDVGFTLAEIATLLDDRDGGRRRWQALAARKLGDLEGRIDQLRAMERLLRAALACTCEDFAACQLVGQAGHRRRGPARPH